MSSESPWPEIDPHAALRPLSFAIETLTGGWDTAIWRFSNEDDAQFAFRIYWEDAREGPLAFAQKRKAEYKGR